MENTIIASVLCIAGIVVGLVAKQKSQAGQFYSDTPWLWPLGVFVWGDGLILGPFWILSSLLFWWWPLVLIYRYFLLFVAIRSAYETIYWINHQVAKRDYEPPLFRRVTWIGSHEAAILYQLLNTVQVIVALGLLLASFNF